MKKGYLSQYFKGVASKLLSAVESDCLKSHQHEFNGVKELRAILGEPSGKTKYQAQFIYLSDNENDPVIEEGFLTWYDARRKARIERSINRYEYRLYFPSNLVMEYSATGDIIIIARKTDDTLLVIIAEKDTTVSNQVKWLFGITDSNDSGFYIRDNFETERYQLELTSRIILESIGILIEKTEDQYLEEMLERFGLNFPTTRIFSEYARSTLSDFNPVEDPDKALLTYMEQEEILFRTLEKHIIGERLSIGFDGDVDSFISFSLSVQNRRKSRAGLALENHLEHIFKELKLKYSRTIITENRSKPDFIFPGKEEYHDKHFNAQYLTMLGVKSTCKDRWRQVLAEADRIENKHLLTLEAAISNNQTDEMKSKNLQLVIPKKIHETYSIDQKKWLMDITTFTEMVKDRQTRIGIRMN